MLIPTPLLVALFHLLPVLARRIIIKAEGPRVDLYQPGDRIAPRESIWYEVDEAGNVKEDRVSPREISVTFWFERLDDAGHKHLDNMWPKCKILGSLNGPDDVVFTMKTIPDRVARDYLRPCGNQRGITIDCGPVGMHSTCPPGSWA